MVSADVVTESRVSRCSPQRGVVNVKSREDELDVRTRVSRVNVGTDHILFFSSFVSLSKPNPFKKRRDLNIK